MYCNPPWCLVVQCVKHLRTWHAKSPSNNKAKIVLPNWSRFKATTIGLTLLRQVHVDIPIYAKPSPLGKRHTLDKVAWLKDTHVKVSSILVHCVAPLHDISTIIRQFYIASHW